jgi:hypothetical protein
MPIVGVNWDDPEQFWSWVDRESDPGGCWLWKGSKGSDGTGSFSHKKKQGLAHRRAYEFSNGPIPPGGWVNRTCLTTNCCNPKHLVLTTDRKKVRPDRHAAMRRIRAEASIETRFWSKVDRRGPDECWEWQASRYKKGYGFFRRRAHKAGRKGDCMQSHRMTWELVNGAIPEGRLVCHTCDNPPCCNPSHLFLGDNDANMRDMVIKGRSHAQRPKKLVREQVVEIRRAYRAGEATQQQLADRFGVTQRRISQLMCRPDWMPRY